MPSGGARLGDQASVTITILTNDDAHGVIGFNSDSVSRVVAEIDSSFVVSLNVDRNEGTFGLVRVQWVISGAHSEQEISPPSGQVQILQEGKSSKYINVIYRCRLLSWMEFLMLQSLSQFHQMMQLS